MLLRFNCGLCKDNKWQIDLNTNTKCHLISCLKCGHSEYLEDIFKGKRNDKDDKPIQQKETRPVLKPTIQHNATTSGIPSPRPSATITSTPNNKLFPTG